MYKKFIPFLLIFTSFVSDFSFNNRVDLASNNLSSYEIYRINKAQGKIIEQKYSLTINFLNSSMEVVHDPYFDLLDPDTSYFVIPPVVDNLSANIPYIEGYIHKDTTIDVIYSQVSVWNGTISESFSGSGTKLNPYLITSASDLALLAKKETTSRSSGSADPYNGKYFKLTKNIDLNNIEWTPIASNFAANYTKPFTAIFDGNNHLISNLYIDKPNGVSYGLFGALGANGMIKNLNLSGSVKAYSRVASLVSCLNATTSVVDNCHIYGTAYCTGNKSNSQYIGAITGVNKGNITNCSNHAHIDSSYGGVGGIAGANQGSINNCDNYGQITLSSSQTGIGGIVGLASGSDTCEITNCNNYAPFTALSSLTGGIIGSTNKKGANILNCNNFGRFISSATSVGGICGTLDSLSAEIKGCKNFGYYESYAQYNGGIVGHVHPGLVTNCVNYGDFNVSQEKYNGGCIGSAYSDGTIIDGCVNHANVNGFEEIGGIAGYITQDVKNCHNYGTINGVTKVGGIVGFLNKGRLDNCTNEGHITALTSRAGGIAGYFETGVGSNNAFLKNSTNSGTITSKDYSGGVVGHCKNGLVENCTNCGLVDLSGQSSGGVIGHLTDSGIAKNLKNTGDVNGNASIGGCIGYAGAATTISELKTSGYINGEYSDTKVIGTDKH